MSAPSRFPGMDPYLECQGYRQDFHAAFLIDCRRGLTAVLPRHYGAFIEERISLVDLSGDLPQVYRPDVTVIAAERKNTSRHDPGGVATLEPITIPLAFEDLEEIRHRWIEIKRLPDRSVVAVIEVLSPTNKSGSGRAEYLEERNDWIKQPVHLIEIDLLLGGHRLPMRRPLPAGEYFALVSRSENRPDCEVYAWSIRRPLPIIPIPLSAPDTDVFLDLQVAFDQTFGDAPYGDSIEYALPLDLPLASEDRAWAEQLARHRE
jgi:hypothetical protein